MHAHRMQTVTKVDPNGPTSVFRTFVSCCREMRERRRDAASALRLLWSGTIYTSLTSLGTITDCFGSSASQRCGAMAS